MLGIIPAAGRGSRIQPLGFSKELLPVGSTREGGAERPCAVSEYLVERMILAGADRICFVIGPGKSDILAYYAGGYQQAAAMFVVQPEPAGLCDALFRAAPFAREGEPVLIGLPDTIWFPQNGFALLPADRLAFLLFPVDHPEFFDTVVLGDDNRVVAIEVKTSQPSSHWVWGAIAMPASVLRELEALWIERGRSDEYVGTLVNAWLARGGQAAGLRAGTDYVDVGTLNGYRAAIDLLGRKAGGETAAPLRRWRNR
jgi:dTDP-glucose pyrophosphorylase